MVSDVAFSCNVLFHFMRACNVAAACKMCKIVVCSTSKMDAAHQQLQSCSITDNQQLLSTDANASRLETEHVHKVVSLIHCVAVRYLKYYFVSMCINCVSVLFCVLFLKFILVSTGWVCEKPLFCPASLFHRM